MTRSPRPRKGDTPRSQDQNAAGLIGPADPAAEAGTQGAHWALQESQERYRAVINQVSDAIFLLEVDTMCILEANPAFERLLGYAAEEIPGLSLYDLLPYDKERIDNATRRALEQGNYRVSERLYRRKDGSFADVEVAITPITYGGKKVLCEVLRDITERKRVEAELKASKREAEAARQNLYDLFMEAPALIAILRGREGRVALFNPRFSKVWGDRDAIGKPMRQAFHELEGQGWFELIEQVYDTGEPVFGNEREAWFDRDGDGESEQAFFNFVCQATHNADGEVKGVAIYGVEVTDLVLARKQAEEAVRVRDDFVSVASHELRTPVTAIKGYSQVLRREAGESGLLANKRITRSLETINIQADRLTALVGKMLDISRIERGQLQLSPEPTDLVELVQEAVDQAQMLASKHSFDLRNDLATLTVVADRERLRQVLANLLDNAIKYSPRGGAVEVGVKVSEEQEEKRAVVSVRDQGIGIPAHQLGHIFEQFYRAPNASVRNYGGLGLGLHISREIVQRHGGKLWVESQEGQGSMFSFSLPLPQASQTSPHGGGSTRPPED